MDLYGTWDVALAVDLLLGPCPLGAAQPSWTRVYQYVCTTEQISKYAHIYLYIYTFSRYMLC